MKITDFSIEVAQKEGGKKQVSLAQIKEIIKIINDKVDGDLYRKIRSM